MREISSRVRNAIRAQVVNNFDVGQVTSPPPDWDISSRSVNRLTAQLERPFLFFESEGSIPVEVSKAERPRDYTTLIKIEDSYATNSGDTRRIDSITDEVIRYLDRQVPAIIGFNAYIQTVESIFKMPAFERNNRTYYKTIITVMTRAEESTDAGGGTGPVQGPIFGFQNFMFQPNGNRIEFHDTGSIVPNTIYPSNNNGFDFVSAAYSLTPGTNGTLDMGSVAVGPQDNVSIESSLIYENETDITITETLTATTAFPRIRSLRAGVLDSTSIDITTLNSDIQFGTISPDGVTVSFTATPGQRGYIVYDANEPDLTEINQQGFSINILDQFTRSVSNGYKIYIQDNPFLFSNTLTATLAT